MSVGEERFGIDAEEEEDREDKYERGDMRARAVAAVVLCAVLVLPPPPPPACILTQVFPLCVPLLPLPPLGAVPAPLPLPVISTSAGSFSFSVITIVSALSNSSSSNDISNGAFVLFECFGEPSTWVCAVAVVAPGGAETCV